MALQIYCGKNFDTQKAERFFKERRIPYQRIDTLKYGIGRRELETIAAATGLSRSTVDAAIDHLERTGSLRRERMASSCPSSGCGGCAHAGGDGSACPSSRIGDGPPGPVALVLTRRS